MSPEYDKRLCEKYPEIFRDRHAPASQTAMCWGFDCDDGWYVLIDELCAALMDSTSQNKEYGHIIPIAIQVKEKFGGLRFYVKGSTKEQDIIIDFAESMSFRICETCGTMKDVTLTGKSWVKTLCPKCASVKYGATYLGEPDDDNLWGV